MTERIDDLQRGGLKILQKNGAFCFGTDAVLLSDFVRAGKRARICDLCTGTGIIPLLVYGRENSVHIDAVEIQHDIAEMAARSVVMNHLENHIRILEGDVRQIRELLPHAAYDIVSCNPPYGKAGGTLKNPDETKRLARHEESCELADVVMAARWLLRSGGKFCCVFPVSRLTELFNRMQEKRIMPKRLRMVHSFQNREANLCLVEGMVDAHEGLRVESPLVIYEKDGSYTDEMKRIYNLKPDENSLVEL